MGSPLSLSRVHWNPEPSSRVYGVRRQNEKATPLWFDRTAAR
jgi:hypothetical protein